MNEPLSSLYNFLIAMIALDAFCATLVTVRLVMVYKRESIYLAIPFVTVALEEWSVIATLGLQPPPTNLVQFVVGVRIFFRLLAAAGMIIYFLYLIGFLNGYHKKESP
jgi:hypothetical protein